MKHEKFLKEMGAECRKLRESNNMSVIEFAKKCHVTRQTIYDFERGKLNSAYIFKMYVFTFND